MVSSTTARTTQQHAHTDARTHARTPPNPPLAVLLPRGRPRPQAGRPEVRGAEGYARGQRTPAGGARPTAEGARDQSPGGQGLAGEISPPALAKPDRQAPEGPTVRPFGPVTKTTPVSFVPNTRGRSHRSDSAPEMFRRQLISCFRHTSPLKQIRTLPSELSGFDELKLTLKVVAKMN